MANINLITIHWGNSYGGVLQTYATIKLLKELGHKVTLINLFHPKRKNEFLKKHDTRIYWLIDNIQFFIFRLIHLGRKTKKMYSIQDDFIPKCDVTIVGSDQVWNNDITGPILLNYFLDFVNKGKKMSFASSFGKYEWNCDQATSEKVKSLLKSFDAVSVREETGVSICKNVFDINPELVLDPTLVYGRFDGLVRNNKSYHEIFTFFIRPNRSKTEICKFISKEINLPIYSPNKIESLFSSGPKSWLKRMKNSDFIITDSFHGLAFSLLFHKRFVILCGNDKQFARLQSLLRLVDLENRFIRSKEDLTNKLSVIHDDVDYKKVDSILANERMKSMGFLSNNIGK